MTVICACPSSVYRRKGAGISPKRSRHLAEKGLEYRRKGNGVSPKRHRCYAEEAMTERFQDGFDSMLVLIRYGEVLKSGWHFVNGIQNIFIDVQHSYSNQFPS